MQHLHLIHFSMTRAFEQCEKVIFYTRNDFKTFVFLKILECLEITAIQFAVLWNDNFFLS